MHVDRWVSGNVVASDTHESRVFPGGCIPVGADSTEQTSRGNSLTQPGQKQLESTVQREREREREELGTIPSDFEFSVNHRRVPLSRRSYRRKGTLDGEAR